MCLWYVQQSFKTKKCWKAQVTMRLSISYLTHLLGQLTSFTPTRVEVALPLWSLEFKSKVSKRLLPPRIMPVTWVLGITAWLPTFHSVTLLALSSFLQYIQLRILVFMQRTPFSLFVCLPFLFCHYRPLIKECKYFVSLPPNFRSLSLQNLYILCHSRFLCDCFCLYFVVV